jgi:hypothetical protein
VKCTSNNCRNTKVYISDVTGFALIVYDYNTNKSWRIKNPLVVQSISFLLSSLVRCLSFKFIAETAMSRFNLAGESFDLADGLFGLAVSPKCDFRYNSYGESQRQLFFHSLASGKENSVPLSVIDNQMNFINNPNAMASSFQTIGNRGVQTPCEFKNAQFLILYLNLRSFS